VRRPCERAMVGKIAVRRARSLLRDVRGASLIEYILIVGCVAFLCVATFRFFGNNIVLEVGCEARRIAKLDPSEACNAASHESAPSEPQSAASPVPVDSPEPPPAPEPPPHRSGCSGGPAPGGGGNASGGGSANSGNGNAGGGGGNGNAGGGGGNGNAGGGGGNGNGGGGGNGGGAAPAPANAAQLAGALVSTAGTATAADRAAVVAEIAKLPVGGLVALQKSGIKITVVRNSIVEALPALKGVRPRGWPPGATWDSVPGSYDPATKQVVIATRGGVVPPTGNGHGSVSLAAHETAHAIDAATGGHNDPAFLAARNQDLAGLSAYEKQPGAAGLEESYAESMARYYGNPAAMQTTSPALYRYWASNPLNKP
jgi:Flp pilus assembly pilin Flp